jgi:hypothetical protein
MFMVQIEFYGLSFTFVRSLDFPKNRLACQAIFSANGEVRVTSPARRSVSPPSSIPALRPALRRLREAAFLPKFPPPHFTDLCALPMNPVRRGAGMERRPQTRFALSRGFAVSGRDFWRHYQGWSRSRSRARHLANILCPFRALSWRLRRHMHSAVSCFDTASDSSRSWTVSRSKRTGELCVRFAPQPSWRLGCKP